MEKEIKVPDIGGADKVTVIEIMVKTGDTVSKDSPLITLESEKASMEIPCPFAGVVKEIKVKLQDTVSEGSLILILDAEDSASVAPTSPKTENTPSKPIPSSAVSSNAGSQNPRKSESSQSPTPASPATTSTRSSAKPLDLTPVLPGVSPTEPKTKAYASPSVRKFARELGVNLTLVTGSGLKSRITKDDVQKFVKSVMSGATTLEVTGGSGIPKIPAVDFSRFGEIEVVPLTRIKKLTGSNLTRSWLNVPLVTQFDQADITELEEFRKSESLRLKNEGIKLTILSFLLKASVNALKTNPEFNASLDPDGKELIYKKYYNIGIAVDTSEGLVVPVIKDVDKKSLKDLAKDLEVLSAKAKEKKLSTNDIQGASFTISSLGGIGGTNFTPLVNAPEVAILGVSKSSIQPIFQNGQFVPRLILPFSLSYDHRVIDGAQAARFTTYLGNVLSDIRRLLL